MHRQYIVGANICSYSVKSAMLEIYRPVMQQLFTLTLNVPYRDTTMHCRRCVEPDANVETIQTGRPNTTMTAHYWRQQHLLCALAYYHVDKLQKDIDGIPAAIELLQQILQRGDADEAAAITATIQLYTAELTEQQQLLPLKQQEYQHLERMCHPPEPT